MGDDASLGRSGDAKSGMASKMASKTSAAGLFALEEAFPDAAAAFSTAVVPPVGQCDALVALDTNALLLPYKLAGGELASLKETYQSLASNGRLFLPARVAREFISNRDARLAELLQTLQNESSRNAPAANALPPHLRSVSGYNDFVQAGEALDKARKAYLKAVRRVREQVEAWRGDDPVTTAYAAVFTSTNIIEHDGEPQAVGEEWSKRLQNRIPPGFKDASKEDTGIGDFLIWKAILKLGVQHKKDLVFVTGEAKTDWMVRSNKEGIYPRPELLHEYRQASGGKAIRFSSLAHLLEEMKVPEKIVAEVKIAEDSANAEIRATSSNLSGWPQISSRHWTVTQRSFDYSTNDGKLTLEDSNGIFSLRFSKASDERIHLLKWGNTARIARAKNVSPGNLILIDSFDTSSSTYTIELGEVFLVENDAGALLIGRIEHIADDTRNNAPGDEVRFSFSTWPKGTLAVSP